MPDSPVTEPRRTCAKAPCPSCPYRKDVPSGVWDEVEYLKLPRYDADTMQQPTELFLCHQQDGHLCAGWVACHGSRLLALRLGRTWGQVDDTVFSYESPVPIFPSGAAAAKHGMAGVRQPRAEAVRLARKLLRQRVRREGPK